MKIKINEVKNLMEKVLIKRGLSKSDARFVAQEHLEGELQEKLSHGLMAFPEIIEKLKSKKGPWKIVKEKTASVLIDGNGNLGQLVGKAAIEIAIKKAKRSGIAIVGIFNMEPYLRPGTFASIAAEKGFIGIVLNNGGKARVAPFGGIDPLLATNPLAIGISVKDQVFLLDMATSARAMGEVRLAKFLGKKLQVGLALDTKGKPTTEPDKVNALLPFGGYKGYGLNLAIEILGGALLRARMGNEEPGIGHRGYLFIVIDPAAFTDLDKFKKETQKLFKKIKRSRKRKGTREIVIPGERGRKKRQRALQRGYFELKKEVIENIKKLL